MVLQINIIPCYQNENGNSPNDSEIIAALNISKSSYEGLKRIIHESKVVSLESPISDDDSLSAVVPESFNMEEQVVEELTRKKLCNDLWKQVNTLNSPSKDVIWYYYHDGISLETIGDELGISGQRCGQLKNEALRVLSQLPKIQEIAKEFDYSCRAAYHGTAQRFRDRGISTVEWLAIKHIELENQAQSAAELLNQILQVV